MSKILCIGDLHFKDNLSYSEYVKDQRIPEKKAILDSIVKSAKDCDHVVLMGDNLNSKNNSSETIREFIAFIEKFDNKEIYVILGNHEKKGNGQSALDFMKEIKRPHWHVMTTPTDMVIDGQKVSFLPYMSKVELGMNFDEEATEILMEGLGGGSIIFAHHAISDTLGNAYGLSTNEFKEVILPKDELEKRYKLVVGGHIHAPQQQGRTLITGSVFTHDIGEKKKFIWKVDLEDMEVEKIKLPCRELWKVENPVQQELDFIHSSSIVKCIITSKDIDIKWIKKELKRFDASILLEQYPKERTKIYFDEGSMDLSIPNLLDIYSKEKKVDIKKLMEGFSLINHI